MNTRTLGMLEPHFDRAASCWNLVAQKPYHRVATVSETPTPVPEADARHFAACWNAIEAIGGDPAKVAAHILALDAIANDAEKWLDADDDDAGVEAMDVGELMNCIADTARKALRGETTPATPPAPELLEECKAVVAVGTCDPNFNRAWAIDKLTAAIAKAEET